MSHASCELLLRWAAAGVACGSGVDGGAAQLLGGVSPSWEWRLLASCHSARCMLSASRSRGSRRTLRGTKAPRAQST
eukprot:4241353-Prymnesium_polylepis.1